MPIDVNERIQARLELYSDLSEAEDYIANDDQGQEFFEFANRLRSKVLGAI